MLANFLFGYTLEQIAIAVVVVAAVIALVVIALRKFNVTIPEWVKQVFWVVVVAVVVIIAIKVLFSFLL